MIRIAIVEDDWVVAQDLKLSLQSLGYEIQYLTDSGDEILELFKKSLPDLALLDIQLKGNLDGIQLAEMVRQKYKIPFIYITAQTDLQTIEKVKLTEPQAYLLKPFNLKELQASIEIAMHKFAKNQEKQNETNLSSNSFLLHNHLFVKTKNRLEKVIPSEIFWIEAKDIYCVIKTSKSQYVVSHSLKELEHILPSESFLRVHRSYMIALDKIEAIEDNSVIISHQIIPIGKTYKDILLQRLRII